MNKNIIRRVIEDTVLPDNAIKVAILTQVCTFGCGRRTMAKLIGVNRTTIKMHLDTLINQGILPRFSGAHPSLDA